MFQKNKKILLRQHRKLVIYVLLLTHAFGPKLRCVYPNLGVAPNRFFHINLDLLVGYLGKSDPKHIRTQMLVNDDDFSSHGIPIRQNNHQQIQVDFYPANYIQEYYDIFTIKINHLGKLLYFLNLNEGDFC